MEGLYLFTCFIGIAVQVYSLVIVNKSKDNKYWNLFTGISIAGFISVILAYFALSNAALGLGDGILCLLVMAISFVLNMIMLITGLIIKKRTQDDGIRLNRAFLPVSIIFIVVNVIVLWVIPSITYSVHINMGEKIVIDYLNDKYGDGNYKVSNVYNEYTPEGMWDEHLSGYYYEIKSSHMSDTFFVLVDDREYHVEQDYFLPVYFSQKNNLSYELYYHGNLEDLQHDFDNFDDYLIDNIEEKHPMDAGKIASYEVFSVYANYLDSESESGYSSNYNIIPDDFGRIPSIEELADRAYIYIK